MNNRFSGLTNSVGKYGKVILYSVVGIAAAFAIYKGGNYIYKNTYARESIQYSTKSFQNQVYDQNVVMSKEIKRNGTKGEIKIKFDKKDLTEEFVFAVDPKMTPINTSLSVEGKINSGEMNVRMIDQNGKDIFNKVVKGANIDYKDSLDTYSKASKIIVTPNAAKNGELTIKFKVI